PLTRCQEWRERVRRVAARAASQYLEPLSGRPWGRPCCCYGPVALSMVARGLGGASVPVGAQIWRDVGRRRRTHPQRRGAREARGRLRPRLRRGGFGHGRPDQSTRLLGGGALGLPP